MNQKQVVSVSANDKSLLIIRDIDSPTPQLEPKGLPVISADLPDDCEDVEDPDELSDKSDDDVNVPTDSLDDDIEKSVPLSSLAWEAFELSSDWSKSLKGDHGILAALDLSLPLPMCNVDISSPTNSRNILDIFSDVMDLPPLNNFIDNRLEPTDDRPPFIVDQPSISADAVVASTSSGAKPLRGVTGSSGGREMDRSNTLMTPQELERMPEVGLEFEQSVGPKELPKLAPISTSDIVNEGERGIGDGRESPLTEEQLAALSSEHAPIILSGKGEELTTITVQTSHGGKMFKVNTGQLREAATMMRPVIINASDQETTITLVMLPVSKVKLLPPDKGTNDGPKYRCLQCERTFPRSYSLRLHEMMKHAREKPYKCPRPGCKWAFTDAYRLRNHEKGHLKIKDHVCELCGKRYASVWNMRIHMDMIHNEKNRSIECELCELTFTAESKLHKHYKEVHPDKPKEFRCPEEECSEEFHSKLGLTRHMLGHKKRDNLALTCPVDGCGKTFKWKSRYDVHLRSHNDERPFKCTYHACAASFTTGSALNRHFRRHTEVKSHVCDICNKSFNRPDHLKNHIAMHRGERPYKCDVDGCTMAFPTRSAMLMHMKRHAVRANRVMLKCPEAMCPAKFVTKAQLIIHINSHHPHVMEKQYSEELAEAAAGGHDFMDETVIATSNVAEQSGNIDWNFDLPNQSNQGLTVVNTTVGEKQIELILPAPLLAEVQSGTQAISSPAVSEMYEKGSARTDRYVNTDMCHKARQRQLQQKEQAMLPLSTTHIPTPMEISSSVEQALPSSIEIYNSAAVSVSEVATSTPQTVSTSADPPASGEEVADSDAVLVNKSMVVSAANIVPAEGATIATSLDQWLTTVNQEGVVVSDQGLVSTADSELVRYTFTSQIEDNPDLSHILDFSSANQ